MQLHILKFFINQKTDVFEIFILIFTAKVKLRVKKYINNTEFALIKLLKTYLVIDILFNVWFIISIISIYRRERNEKTENLKKTEE